MMQPQIIVMGASNIDITATSNAPLVAGDSNPGKMRTGFGGVGRNIAENLIRMQKNVRFITAYGGDSFAQMLQNQAKDLGLDVSLSLFLPEASSSTYICMNQPNGEMSVAISDMEVCDALLPAHLQQQLPALQRANVVLADTNLPAQTLAFLAENCPVPLFVDTVSTKKAAKLRPILSGFTGIKTNRHEAEVLTGITIESEKDAQKAADALHALGISYVLLTRGGESALVSHPSGSAWMRPLPSQLVNTTGCGDAFFAGATCAWLEGGNYRLMLEYGLGLAALCSESNLSVSPFISPTALHQILQKHCKERSTHETF